MASFPFAFARLSRIAFRAFAELDASKPAFARPPSRVVVAWASSPNALATGATIEMEVCSFENERADFEQEAAMRSRRGFASEAFIPNALSAAPEKSAALARSVPTAAANFKTGSCIDVI